MKKLVTGMLVTSVALAMLVGTEGAYARENRKAPEATYGQQDRGTAIDTQATGEDGIERSARQGAIRRCAHRRASDRR